MPIQKNTILIVAAVLVCGTVYMLKSNDADSIIELESTTSVKIESTVETEKIVEPTSESLELKVYVCGAVNNPSIVTLKSGDRISDAIELAEGITSDADLNNINLAEFVHDAQKIYVPKVGEEVDKIEFTEQNSDMESVQNLININKADKSQLTTLPGVGDTIAEYIIDYRNQNGDFKSIEDLKNVTRIGNKTFEKLKDKITVSN